MNAPQLELCNGLNLTRRSGTSGTLRPGVAQGKSCHKGLAEP